MLYLKTFAHTLKVNILKLAFKVFLVAIFTLSIVIISSVKFPSEADSDNVEIKSYIGDFVNIDSLESLNQQVAGDFLNQKQAIESELQLKKDIDARTASVEALFSRYNSPMSGYGRIIVEQAARCGGDYKVLIGIAGNESGLGRIPYKLYNPFGYLDGVQYSSWEEALSYLSCKISQQHLAPCNNDLQCIVRKYGGPDTDKVKWVNSVRWFMNQI